MSERAENGSSRSAYILLAVLVVVAAYSIAYGLQTLIFLESRHWATSNPYLNEAPQTLPAPASSPALAANPSPGTQLEYYNYRFMVPWKEIEKESEMPYYRRAKFRSGQVIVFLDPDFQVDTLQALKTGRPDRVQRFSNIFADRPIDSNYALYEAVYNASPAQASPLMPRSEAIRLNVLLIWKLSYGIDAQPGIFLFSWGNYRGIQFGDPARGPVWLRAFDRHDRQFRFLFTTAGGSDATISEDDIAQAVQSLQSAF